MPACSRRNTDWNAIFFHGTATDPTDGTLMGSALVWSDSLEGQFGTGDPVMWAPTMTGTHTVTLTATDSLMLTGMASVTFMVTPGASTSSTGTGGG